MNSPPNTPRTSWLLLGRRFWVPFLLACVLVFLAEAGVDHAAENRALPGVTQSVFNVSGLYQRLVSAPRDPLPRYTAVVEFNPKRDPTTSTMLDICEQRGVTAQLLRSIAQALPRAIVLDKHYEPRPRPCTQDAAFLGAVRDLREAGIPVIIGRRVADEPIKGQGGDRYYLKPSLEFWAPSPCPNGLERSGQGCMDGVTARDNDSRKLPLEWMVYASEEMARRGEGLSWHDTLTLSAARAYDANLMEHHPRLVPFVDKGEHPYVSFFPNDRIEPIPAARLLEPEAVAVPTHSSDLRKLSGKVVLIGEINWDSDVHPSVVGKSPGLYLQANYVEALLDDRYFRPQPVLDYVLGFLILLGLELILIFPGHWWTKVLLIVALFGGSIGLLFVLIKIPGWYVNPAPVGATAILIKLTQPLFGHAEQSVRGAVGAGSGS